MSDRKFHENEVFVSADGIFALAFCRFDSKSEPNSDELTDRQKEICQKFKSAKRKHEYIAGRHAGKRALSVLSEKCSLEHDQFDFEILNDANGAPIVADSPYDVTISHTTGLAVAVAFDKKMSFGIDIEKVSEKRRELLRKLSPECAQDKITSVDALTAAWSLKEALSKALKTGIREKFATYELKNFRTESNFFRCEFSNFQDYIGIAFIVEDISLSIVFPKGYSFPTANVRCLRTEFINTFKI